MGTLFVPAVIKSLLYFGYMIALLHLGQVIILIPLIVCIAGVEALEWWIRKYRQLHLP